MSNGSLNYRSDFITQLSVKFKGNVLRIFIQLRYLGC